MKGFVLSVIAALTFTACGQQTGNSSTAQGGDISVEKAAEKMQEPNVIILDVRTPREFASGHIGGATNINISSADFNQRLKEVPKDTAVVVYCRSGGRSAKAMRIMQDQGFTEVYNMQGGIMAWAQKGKEVKK
jgi:rhodanese-related sulfurtransferase